MFFPRRWLLPILLMLSGWLCSSLVLATDTYSVFPQIAVGDGWSSDIFLTNRDKTTATLTCRFT